MVTIEPWQGRWLVRLAHWRISVFRLEETVTDGSGLKASPVTKSCDDDNQARRRDYIRKYPVKQQWKRMQLKTLLPALTQSKRISCGKSFRTGTKLQSMRHKR